MEKQNLYVLYDRLAEECGPIFQCSTHALARRRVVFMLVQSKGFPEDYEIRWVGTVSLSDGRVWPSEPICVPFEAEYTEKAKEIQERMFPVPKSTGLRPWRKEEIVDEKE